MQGFQFELIFVDDGSKDRTLEICKELKLLDERVHYLSFSRNFGKEAALYAGLKAATGDYIAVMDADLQDPPELLKDMLSILQNDNQIDCVATRRTTRKGEPPIRSFFAKNFYKLINKISKAEIMDGARDFRMMTRQVVDTVLSMEEYNRFSKGIFGWIGFRTKWLDYVNVERVAGETKWSFWKLFLYAIDGIIAFSTMPLVIASLSGILFCDGSLFCGKDSFIWRSCSRFSNLDLPDFADRGSPAFLYRYFGPILIENLLGSKEKTDLYCKRNR